MKEYMILLFVFTLVSFLGISRTAEPAGVPGAGQAGLLKATFAGGCFWCMQPPFDKLEGVISTTVGYIGGQEQNATYEQVCSGTTDHAEAIQVVYDASRVSYSQLLEVFWRNINPTQPDGQFVDTGRQYRTVIFYHDEEQQRLAEASRDELEKSGRYGRQIVTEIVPATPFYPAEDYHQEYYKKSPLRYQYYRSGSGRDHYLEKLWEK